ncbi:serine/threonine protein kinase [Actinomadura scrupuli]|uniref:serine/threonine protein kinase n=1 Tax=Actinomadura scrupuli TaxID=559629 RepID=UPI003D985292
MVTTIADRYRLDPVHIGKGGMGEVWGATDTRLGRRVAVKFISFPDGRPDPELTRRFVRESKLTAQLEHPGVPVLYDAAKVTEGPFEGRLYLVMQLVDGVNLDDLVAEQDPLPIDWAAAIAAQTCAVLQYAHERQVIHRDLKPSNLMLSRDGTVKVLDFGLAVALNATDQSRITHTNQMLGTLAYMSPEQFRGEPSALSDLYALGCVLHLMLTRKLPFDGPTEASIMHAQIYEDPAPARSLRQDVPLGLEALVLRLLAKMPGERPASAEEVYDLLMPYSATIGELPGFVDPGLGSLRRYVGVLSRFSGSSLPPVDPPDMAPPLAAKPLPAPDSGPISLGDIARARRQADRLVRESRYGQAARLLTGTADKARTVLGADHSDVIGLRMDLANVLFTGGDYAEAAVAFEALARDLARRDGPDADLVLRLRFQEASCQAVLGNGDLALERMEKLLGDERRVHGEDDSRVLELRRQIGLLLAGVGRTTEALQVLEELAADLGAGNGPEHPASYDLRNEIARMREN